jgi:uncharacterized protein
MPEHLTDLDAILTALGVEARDGAYVVATVDAGSPAVSDASATIVENEGITVVLHEEVARRHGIVGESTFAWLTLTVFSSFEAVGLTAAFSAVLADANISCNVLAGYHHDHLLVPSGDRDRALQVLRGLRTNP